MNRVRTVGRCRTGKERYRDRVAALLALAWLDNTDPKRRECRAYRCDLCRGWHLTSQTKRSKTAGRSSR